MLPPPMPQQPIQQAPQRPVGFANQPPGINLFAQPPPALAPRGIEMKSAGAPPPNPQYQPPQQAQPGFAPPAQAPPSYYGAYGGAPAVYQQPIDTYSYYYDDYYGESEQVSAGNKAVTVLFTITVVLCFLAVGFYFYQEWQKKKNPQGMFSAFKKYSKQDFRKRRKSRRSTAKSDPARAPQKSRRVQETTR